MNPLPSEPDLPQNTPEVYARSNAEILLWQSRNRIGLALVIAALSLALRLGHVLTELPSLGVATIGGYVVLIASMDVLVRRSGRAPDWAVGVVVLADTLFVFGITFLAVPPQYYDRALLFSFAVVHLTEFYFGRAMAWLAMGTTVVAYLAVVTHAILHGAPLSWPQEIWSLGVFVLAAAALLLHYGDFKRRLANIVALFERAEKGDFSGTYVVARDQRPDSLTAVGRAYNRVRAQLATMVLTDPLSGCLNRRGLEQQLARELRRAVRSGAKVALLALDVDNFKTVNDTFGHPAGDAVVREVGLLLREVVRAGDVIARLGGDEFAVLLPGTDVEGAFKIATRIRDAFAKRQFAGVAGRIPITVSIGVVADHALTPDEETAHDLQSRADEALYAAKKAGRDRAWIWTPDLRAGAPAPAGQHAIRG